MGRPCLVLALVLVSAAPAAAKREPFQCPERITTPAYDATEVPTNAQSIDIDPWVDPMFTRTSLGDLEPNTPYHLENPVQLSFTTGPHPDIHPPHAPQAVHPTITVTSKHVLNTVAMPGTYDDDTSFLEIEVASKAGGSLHFGMKSYAPVMVGFEHGNLAPGPATVTVWALDYAGNRSEPLTVDTVVIVDNEDTTADCRHHFKCGMGSMALLFLIPVAAIGLLLLLGVISLFRRTRIDNTPGEHVSVILGESVARVVAHAYLVKSALGVIATIGLLAADFTVSAALVIPFTLIWLLRLARARRLVSRFDAPVNRLERRDDWLLVDHTLLYCGRRAWKRAARVPAASIRTKP